MDKKFSLRLEEQLYAKLKAVSEEDKRSMNSWVVIVIEKEMLRYRKAHKK